MSKEHAFGSKDYFKQIIKSTELLKCSLLILISEDVCKVYSIYSS